MSFHFDTALSRWRANLARRADLTPEFRNELESSLHDHYDARLIRGDRPEEAFAFAVAQVTPPVPPPTGNRQLFGMLPHYLKVAGRQLRRRWGFTAVNFACLSIGILTGTLALLYLDYETSYDTFVPDYADKYRVGRNYRSQGYSVNSFPNYFGSTAEDQQAPLRGLEAIPDVVAANQFFTFEGPTFVYDDQRRFAVGDILQTNTPGAWLDFFGWEFLLGSAATFTARPYQLLLTESEAARFYGQDWRSQDILDRSLRIDTTDFRVAGVLKDVPSNAHYDFSLALHQPRIDYWGGRLYLTLTPGADPDEVAARISDNIGSVNPDMAEDELFGGVLLQNLSDIHLRSDLLYELRPPGDPRYLYIIGIIAGIILLLTVSNYSNLAVAMSLHRTREIGLRKVFGAGRGQVAGQFILEALLLSVLTVPVVALGLYLLLPPFNTLMGTEIATDTLGDSRLWVGLLGVCLAVGLLAGLFPAWRLSGRGIMGLFRARNGSGPGKKFAVRKAIIAFQFALLIGLSSLTIFVNRQFNYLQTKDLGYERDNVLYVSTGADSTRFVTLKAELEKLPEVIGVGAEGYMGTTGYNQTTYQLSGSADVFDDAHLVEMSYDAARLLGLATSVDERLADPDAAPARTVLINETLADRFAERAGVARAQLPDQTVVLEPEFTNPETGQVGFPLTVGGTFEDIHMFSLRDRVDPMILILRRSPSYVYWASVKYQNSTPAAMRAKAADIFQRLNPTEPFVHTFLQENLAELYAAEARIARLCTFFSGVAFVVAVLGLIALTVFLTTLRRKEIGIRKILGASTLDILGRLNREYLVLLGIGLLIAAPLAYWGVTRWLAGFAYRITVSPWVFLWAVLATLLITVVSVSLMSWRVATALPIRALRDDQ